MAGGPDSKRRGAGKNKAFLMNRLQDMYGEDFHPIMQMAKNADTLQKRVDVLADSAESQDLLDASKAWGDIAQYVEPKLKAVEHKGDLGLVMVKRINLSGDDKLDDDDN
ncbi:hypothetical protein N9878_00720 [bacterium]|nr:hypothetical protein [bacterium]